MTFATGADGTLKLDAAKNLCRQHFRIGARRYTRSFESSLTALTQLWAIPGPLVGGVLSVTNGSQTAISPSWKLMASTFTLGSDGHGGTTVGPPQDRRDSAYRHPRARLTASVLVQA